MSDDDTFSLGQGPFTLNSTQPVEFVITMGDEFNLRINADGTIDIGPGLTPDEAGRQAIDGMRHQLQWIIAAARSAALEEAAKVADRMQESGLYRQMPHPAAVAAAIRELKDK